MIFLPRIAVILSIVLFMFGMPPANAQIQSEIATPEDVAIAFFKAGGSNPDFDKWAREGRDYKTAAPVLAGEALEKEKQRLMRRWKDYDEKSYVLNVRGDVMVSVKATANKETGADEYWMYMQFEDGDVTYFPYQFQDYNFAVIPQKIETLMSHPIQEVQYRLLLGTFKGQASGIATLYLQLRPAQAYTQQPYVIDDTEQWVLLTDVATMSLASKRKNDPLWNYSANWYIAPKTKELQDLYRTPGQ